MCDQVPREMTDAADARERGREPHPACDARSEKRRGIAPRGAAARICASCDRTAPESVTMRPDRSPRYAQCCDEATQYASSRRRRSRRGSRPSAQHQPRHGSPSCTRPACTPRLRRQREDRLHVHDVRDLRLLRRRVGRQRRVLVDTERAEARLHHRAQGADRGQGAPPPVFTTRAAPARLPPPPPPRTRRSGAPQRASPTPRAAPLAAASASPARRAS